MISEIYSDENQLDCEVIKKLFDSLYPVIHIYGPRFQHAEVGIDIGEIKFGGCEGFHTFKCSLILWNKKDWKSLEIQYVTDDVTMIGRSLSGNIVIYKKAILRLLTTLVKANEVNIFEALEDLFGNKIVDAL